ncbi:MAG: hypothetical protein ACMUEL_04395 [Flavobacteriales bacterium Tduv]
MEKEIRKIYQKDQGIKRQPAYSGISLFKMMFLSHWYDLSECRNGRIGGRILELHALL